MIYLSAVAAIAGVLIVGGLSRRVWVWILLGLGTVAGSLAVGVWANSSMPSPDRAAPSLVGAVAFCVGLPLSLVCFRMAALGWLPKPEVSKGSAPNIAIGTVRRSGRTPLGAEDEKDRKKMKSG